jgi:hypothetical protein
MLYPRPYILNCTALHCTALISTTTGPRYIGSARATQKNTSRVIATQRVPWRADCCLATTYNIRPLRQSFLCCELERVYRAVA